MKKLSIIIPCYNEEANLKRDVLKTVYEYLKKQKYAWEVIIADDGSTDNSRKLIEEQIKSYKGFLLQKNPHGGKPSTLLYGIKKATGDYVLFLDMDQSTPISELEKLLPYLNKYDVVIGSRGLKRKNFSFYRQIGAFVFSNFRKAMLLPEIEDTQCGFKLFRRELLDKHFKTLEFFRNEKNVKGWTVTSYDVELLHILKKNGSNIKEIIVKWNDEDISTSKGSPLMKYIKESQSMIKQILRVKINDLKGFYN